MLRKNILIGKGKLMSKYCNYVNGCVMCDIELCNGKEKQIIRNDYPYADIEPIRRGKWIMKPDPYGFFAEIPVCSECGCTTKMRETYNFCPNCGAHMDKGDT